MILLKHEEEVKFMAEITEILKKKVSDPKFKALTNEFRRFLVGLLYASGPMYQSDILKNVKVDSNLLAYHLNILVAAGLVRNEFVSREGRKFSRYYVTDEGVRFLDFLGVKDQLEILRYKKSQLLTTS